MKFRSLIVTGFALLAASQLDAQIPNDEYAARRTALAQKLGDGILVALGSPEPEEDFLSFNQNSNFKYLTGFNEPEAALVMVVQNGAIAGTPMLFVEPSDPAREESLTRNVKL